MAGVLDKSLGCMEFGGSLGAPLGRKELGSGMSFILCTVASSGKEVVRQNTSLNLVSMFVHDLGEDSSVLDLVAIRKPIFFIMREVRSHVAEGAVDEEAVEIVHFGSGPVMVGSPGSEALEDLTKAGFVNIVSIDSDVGFGDGDAVGGEERIDL